MKIKQLKIINQDQSTEVADIGADAINVDYNDSTVKAELDKLNNNVDTNTTNISSEIATRANAITNLQSQVSSLASGGPAGVYATVAALTAADPDHSKIYVVSADGHWYYYNDGWKDGGVYQSSEDSDNVNYLLSTDNVRNEIDFDIVSDVVGLSQFTNICKNNMIHFIETSQNGLTNKIEGLSKFHIVGTTTGTTFFKFSKPFTIKANTTYTLGAFNYNRPNHDGFMVYLYISGASTSTAKDKDNQSIGVTLNYDIQNNVKVFTVGNSDIEVQVGVYHGQSGIVRNHMANVVLVEGEYSVNDLKTSSELSEHLQGRVFKGTCSPSTTIPTYKVPVFYFGKGPGPYTNFGSNEVFADCSYIIMLNTVSTGTWTIYSLPLMTNDAIIRTSLATFIPTSEEPSIIFGRRQWGLCAKEGTYTNFLDYKGNALSLNAGEVAIFSLNYEISANRKWWQKDIINNLTTKTYVDTEIEGAISPIIESIETYVYNWLNAHPEATTTVEDGSITVAKLDSSLAAKANRLRLDSKSSTTYLPNHNDLNNIIGDNNMPNGIGSRNTILGIDNMIAADSTHSPNYEVAIGYHSLFRDWDGDHNISIGNEAMDNVSHGSYNTAVGSNALRSQFVPDYGGSSVEGETETGNTCVGGDSMCKLVGSYNTALGYQTLYGAYGATGSSNVAIGYHAGYYNTNESNHLYIDNKDRNNRTNEINKSLIYGTFADDIADQFVKINGMFACNGATPVAARTAEANATDLASAIILLNQIKTVLIETGLMKDI